MKRPAHVSVVIAAVLASLTGCRHRGESDHGEGHASHSHAADDRRRGRGEARGDYDELIDQETAYRERMRSRAQERSHQRALDRDFERELYESAIADWP